MQTYSEVRLSQRVRRVQQDSIPETVSEGERQLLAGSLELQPSGGVTRVPTRPVIDRVLPSAQRKACVGGEKRS